MKYTCLLVKSIEFSGPHRAYMERHMNPELQVRIYRLQIHWSPSSSWQNMSSHLNSLRLHKITSGFLTMLWLLADSCMLTNRALQLSHIWKLLYSYVLYSYDFCLDFWNVPIKLLRPDVWKYICNIFLKLCNVLSNVELGVYFSFSVLQYYICLHDFFYFLIFFWFFQGQNFLLTVFNCFQPSYFICFFPG